MMQIVWHKSSSASCMHISGRSRIFKRRFLVLQKFSSELVEDQKKKVATSISKHNKFNLASRNTPNLTQLTSMTLKTSTSTTKKGCGTTFEKF